MSIDDTKAYSGFAVPDLEAAREFYAETLGVTVSEVTRGAPLLQLDLNGGERATLLYEKPDHKPANYTILNFPVADVDAAVDELIGKGVEFEQYDGFEQDEKGIARRRARHGTDDRLVQGPGGEHPGRPRGRLGRA